MPYFKTKDVAAITIFAALWGVLNSLISPIIYQIIHLPFMCDLIGFTAIIVATWYVRRLGTATMVGFIATIINFIFVPTAIHFLGFTAASIAFDALAFLVGYKRMFAKRLVGSISLFAISVLSAAVAGLLIATFFMTPTALQNWGGVAGWAGVHAVGGVLGGAIGVALINALALRGITHAEN